MAVESVPTLFCDDDDDDSEDVASHSALLVTVTVVVCHAVTVTGGWQDPQPSAIRPMGKHLVCPKLGSM